MAIRTRSCDDGEVRTDAVPNDHRQFLQGFSNGPTVRTPIQALRATIGRARRAADDPTNNASGRCGAAGAYLNMLARFGRDVRSN